MEILQQIETDNYSLASPRDNIKNEEVIFLRSSKVITKMFLSEIDYFIGEGNRTKCFAKGEIFLLNTQLKDVEKMLPEKIFVRIHKSYIIAINKIDKIIKHVVYINENPFPIGPFYRKMFYSNIFPL